MQEDICGDLRTGGWKLLKGAQQCTECNRTAISMYGDSHISCGLKYMKASVRHKEMYKMIVQDKIDISSYLLASEVFLSMNAVKYSKCRTQNTI